MYLPSFCTFLTIWPTVGHIRMWIAEWGKFVALLSKGRLFSLGITAEGSWRGRRQSWLLRRLTLICCLSKERVWDSFIALACISKIFFDWAMIWGKICFFRVTSISSITTGKGCFQWMLLKQFFHQSSRTARSREVYFLSVMRGSRIKWPDD